MKLAMTAWCEALRHGRTCSLYAGVVAVLILPLTGASGWAQTLNPPLRAYETAAGVDRSGENATMGGWTAELSVSPERLGVADGETLEAGVVLRAPAGATGRATFTWQLTGSARDLHVAGKREMTLRDGQARDALAIPVRGWGAGDYWLACEVGLPDGQSLRLRRPLVVINQRLNSEFTIYGMHRCGIYIDNPKTAPFHWRGGADLLAAEGFNLVYNNILDCWNINNGAERLDFAGVYGLRYIDFPSTIDWTCTHSPVMEGGWDNYHDPAVRAFCRQLSQGAAQWGRCYPAFTGISLMDEPYNRGFWGNNAEVFKKRFLTYDGVKEPLRYAADWAWFTAWSMGDLFADCRTAIRKVDPDLGVSVEITHELKRGYHPALNNGALDINTVHYYAQDCDPGGWDTFSVVEGCEASQLGLRTKPLWMLGGYSEPRFWRPQAGQALARGAQGFGCFTAWGLSEENLKIIRPLNQELARWGSIFVKTHRRPAAVGVLYSVRNVTMWHDQLVQFGGGGNAGATVAALNKLHGLSGKDCMYLHPDSDIRRPDGRSYDDACRSTLMGLTLSGYYVQYVDETELTPEGLAGKRVLIAPHLVYLTPEMRAGLEQFVKGGGVLIVDPYARVALDLARVAPFHTTPDGSGDTEFLKRTAAQDQPFEAMRQELVKAVSAVVTPELTGQSPDMVYGLHEGGEAVYLVLANTHHERDAAGKRQLAPFAGDVVAHFATDSTRVRLGETTLCEGAAAASWRETLTAGDFAIHAFLKRPIDAVGLTAASAAIRGQPFEFKVELAGKIAQPLPAVVPLEIEVLDDKGQLLARFWRATDAKGAFADSILPGLAGTSQAMTIRVTELLTGKRVEKQVAIHAAKTAGPSVVTLPPILVSDEAAIAAFAKTFQQVLVVVPDAASTELLAEVEKLRPLFEELVVQKAAEARKDEKLPPWPRAHPHFNPHQLQVGRATILVGTPANNTLIADVTKANLLPRRPTLPIYAVCGLIQYLWSPFDPDLDAIVISAPTTELERETIRTLVGIVQSQPDSTPAQVPPQP